MVLKSASKLVFLAMAGAVIALTAYGKVESTDFVLLASMTFAFYYTKSK